MGPRKYFLDWLRVGAFGLLILFHVGMLYVSWPFNLKSPHLIPRLEPWMNAFSVWRMPLLFVISGVACSFLIGKLGPGAFALDRVRRLLPAVITAMFVVIPPQTYVELLAKGVTRQGYLHFWWFSYLAADQTLVRPLGKTMPTWDHLWFVVYLLNYSLLFALGAWVARRLDRRPVERRIPLSVLLIGPALWLVATQALVERVAPLTHDLVHDWGGHLKWIGLFALGVTLAGQPAFWDWLEMRRRWLLAAAAGLLALQCAATGLAWDVVSGLYAWAAICAICGYAKTYLNRPSTLLTHLNEAVLPVYVLHQPILLMAAFWIFPLGLPAAAEGTLLAAITGVGSLAIYEALIRPFAVTRFLFGLRAERRPRAQLKAA